MSANGCGNTSATFCDRYCPGHGRPATHRVRVPPDIAALPSSPAQPRDDRGLLAPRTLAEGGGSIPGRSGTRNLRTRPPDPCQPDTAVDPPAGSLVTMATVVDRCYLRHAGGTQKRPAQRLDRAGADEDACLSPQPAATDLGAPADARCAEPTPNPPATALGRPGCRPTSDPREENQHNFCENPSPCRVGSRSSEELADPVHALPQRPRPYRYRHPGGYWATGSRRSQPG